VGFPGETEEQFQETLTLVREVQFDSAYTFIYSPREGTAAARWLDSTPRRVKQQRLEQLMKLQQSISLAKNQELEGQTVEVLVEGPSKKDPTVLSSRTTTNKLVHIPVGDAARRQRLTGQFIQARIIEAHTWTLRGEVADV
jgi:tRNA-2-methylthio-N6-dimethylallyladenosine synthase